MSSQPRRGDLRVVMPPAGTTGDARLALVLAVHTAERFAEVALLHSYHELATSMDAVVPGTLAGTPYAVVVQTDLRGVVRTAQVSCLVGRLSHDTLDTISDLLSDRRPGSGDGIRTGIPLAGPCDRRWSFKVEEGSDLDVLTTACTTGLIGTG